MMNERVLRTSEQGFILATSLVMLVLLTMLSIATYYGTIISQQTSAAAQESTQAYYYAETGLNYVAWALKNDAEFDGYSYVAGVTPAYLPMDRYAIDAAGNQVVILNEKFVGDRREWQVNRGHPSALQSIQPVFQSGQQADVYGQLAYFDNRDIYSRPVALIGSSLSGSDIYSFGQRVSPSFRDVYTQLGGYIRLDIDAYGSITPSFSQSGQHGANAHVCHGLTIGDVPCNGAIVWLTAGDPYTDRVLYPIDPYVATPLWDVYGDPFHLLLGGIPLKSVKPLRLDSPPPGGTDVEDVYTNGVVKKMTDPFPAYYQSLPCDLYTYSPATDVACEQPISGTGQWLTQTQYNLVVYAIGYSGGQARKMIRMIIQM